MTLRLRPRCIPHPAAADDSNFDCTHATKGKPKDEEGKVAQCGYRDFLKPKDTVEISGRFYGGSV